MRCTAVHSFRGVGRELLAWEPIVFTGLVECMGSLVERQADGSACRLRITAPPLGSDPEDPRGVRIGDSIAVNGCCLTVVRCADHELDFEAGAETLRRTNLGALQPGDPVNLERSLRVGDRLGGHFVTGHIDGVGQLSDRDDDGPWSTCWFSVPAELSRFLAAKGCVAVDGISLTVVDVADSRFSVALIPHTLQQTTLGRRRIGDAVNIETDLLAKYILRAEDPH